jgi:hypothetical protein
MVVIYSLISLQTVIQYSVVYLLYMNKSLKWIQSYEVVMKFLCYNGEFHHSCWNNY